MLIFCQVGLSGFHHEILFVCLFSILFYLTLQYCIGFAIYQNESATGIHVFPILNPPPSSLPIVFVRLESNISVGQT